jgi:hypothetical protein
MGLEVLASKVIYRYSLDPSKLQAVALHDDHIERRGLQLGRTAGQEQELNLSDLE